MIQMRKLLKPGLLRAFLLHALDMMDESCSLALFCNGEQLISVGPHPRPESPDEPGVINVSVVFANERQGELALKCGDLDGLAQSCRLRYQKILDFAAFSLQGFIELEAARRSIADETLSKYRELAMQHRAIVEFNNSLRLRDVTRALIQECRSGAIPAEMGLALLDESSGEDYRPADCFGELDLSPLASSPLVREIADKDRGEVLNELAQDPRWRGEIPQIRSLLLQPIASPNLKVGVIALASTRDNAFDATHLKHLSTLASVAGIAMSNALNFEGVQDLMDALLQALAEAIDARDPFTAGHSRRVACLCAAFAHVLNRDRGCFKHVQFTPDEIGEIYFAGILHDVGKIGVREEVLTKATRLPEQMLEIIRARLELCEVATETPAEEHYSRLKMVNRSMHPPPEDLDYVRKLGEQRCTIKGRSMELLKPEEKRSLLLEYGNLTPEERKEIERHPAESHRILQHIPFHDNYRNLRTIVRQHHERMDGSGYPDGLTAEDILLQSRMMMIVDIYDAMTQDRHYKSAFSRDQAVSTLRKEALDGKLDKGLVDAFSSKLDQIETLSRAIEQDRLRVMDE
jgi:HD-GYP domain-containing protein (c-di-GMP phosphodiesterase class II)